MLLLPRALACTCAVAVFTRVRGERRVLLVHPTGAGHLGSWSLPKGVCEDDETHAAAAVRELREETSLDLTDAPLVDHGEHAYLRDKNYHLFSTELPTAPDVGGLLCETTFERGGKRFPEVDRFTLADLESALVLLNKKQAAIFAVALKD